MIFCSCRKNGLIRKVRLISKFMTPQPGWQTITIHILLNISPIKGNQSMKFGRLIEYKFHCLIAFNSWDIGHYMYCNCFLTSFFEINFIFLIKLFLYMIKKARQKLKYLENKKSFQGEIKRNYSSFLNKFQLLKIVSQTWECTFNPF